jgi:hypothetical protein
VVLVPDMHSMRDGLCLMSFLQRNRDCAEEAYARSALEEVPAAMAVTYSNGQQYSGKLLLQPLLQLLVPTVQFLLDATAAEAAQQPATHMIVQERVGLVTFTSKRLVDLLNDGETEHVNRSSSGAADTCGCRCQAKCILAAVHAS